MKSEIIEINQGVYSKDIIDDIADFIKNNKVVIMPSDTIYGFMALPELDEKIRIIKKRDKKPFLYIISNDYQINDIDENIDIAIYKNIFKKYWPGPFTFIIKSNKYKSLGIRMPDWDILLKIINRSGSYLISTSVNVSGSEALNDPDDIVEEFGNKVDLIIIDRNIKKLRASTIVDLTGNNYKVIREGEEKYE